MSIKLIIFIIFILNIITSGIGSYVDLKLNAKYAPHFYMYGYIVGSITYGLIGYLLSASLLK